MGYLQIEILPVVQYLKEIIPETHRTANLLRFGVKIQRLVLIVRVSAISTGNYSKDALLYYTSRSFTATLGPNVKKGIEIAVSTGNYLVFQ